jgi:hydrogenase maturation protease
MSAERDRRVAVIGVGNLARSDDGLGICAIQRLRERNRYPPEVALIDGGIAGLLLLPHIATAARVIVIDAVNTGAAAGTLVRLVDPKGAFATGLTPHDVGLADLLDAARLTDAWPETLVLHGAQPASTAIDVELTRPVATALGALVDAVEAELSAWGYPAGVAGARSAAPDRDPFG